MRACLLCPGCAFSTSGPVTIYCRLTEAHEQSGWPLPADLGDSCSGRKQWARLALCRCTACGCQHSAIWEAPPKPHLSQNISSTTMARSSPPFWLEIPAIRFTAFAVRLGNHVWLWHGIRMFLVKVRKLD